MIFAGHILPGALAAWMATALGAAPTGPALRAESVDVAPVWAGHSVGFALLTKGDLQFVAFYDANRQMTLGQRTLPAGPWKFKKLPSFLKWDSHNYVTMAFDPAGCLHVSGNMHVVPLVYFRATQPLDIDSVVPVNRMTGENETRVTYPEFFYGPGGDLIFSYRDGSSGNGNNLLNIYDVKTKTWRRLLSESLMDGTSRHMNAYMTIPRPGPDGFYHVSWVWRNSPDASMCHDLSYIRSRDLVHWETVDGRPLTLPITIATPGVIVDPVPVKGGILNGMGAVGFDAQGRAVLSYAKYDAAGKTQLYFARFENGAWKHYLASNWTTRIEFQGGGSLPSSGIHIGAVEWHDGKLTLPLFHEGTGGGFWQVDPGTMKLTGHVPASPLDLAFSHFGKVESTFPGLQVHWIADSGHADDGTTYRLRWEALPPNRDQPRLPPLPPPSMLRVVSVAPAGR